MAGAAAFGALRVERARAATELRMAWWGSDERHQRTLQALELFSQQNPEITVSSEVGTFDSHFDKLAVQTAGGNAPDVFQMSGQLINEYAARGTLLDLNQFIPTGIDTSAWDSSVTSHGLINGSMAGLPIGLDAYTICYDAAKMAEFGLEMPGADVTWEAFAAFATQVAQTVGNGYFGVADAGGRYEPLETLVRQRGKTFFSADGVGLGFEQQDLVDYWTYWNDLRMSGAATSAEVQAAATSEELGALVQGTAAMYFTTSSQFVNLQGLTEQELGLHTLPVGPGGETGSFVRPGLFISAYANTRYPQESALLINFLLNNPESAAILLTARGVPPAPAIREQIQSLVTPEEQKTFGFIDQITTASTQSNILTPAGGLEVTDLLMRSYQAIAFEQTSIDEAADDFFAQAPSLLGA
jgi:multiple sugar transport system substrate-binding protein